MTLPPPILAYFDADARNDRATLVNAFAPDAVVTDEARSHVGRDAIGAWWSAAKATYQYTTELLGMTERGDVTEIRARVTGRFPGSPASLTFAFRLEGDRITGLEITA
ncbi:nuclear transport factor 2 family protein [Rhodospirillum centenum]|uniref:SnoaL-like domain-containing protein n=1 Tax=Rhodospirillum centenum (strain ATCC 51521 / SW) TaxID=414684 RepID=B6IVJ2_RHOCS|nr:nuclear transport factor 2 family protein [Rhodospirillum centenum]ACJ00316.1 conserved hypothetical protein [Rhodospirillum centenum SW]